MIDFEKRLNIRPLGVYLAWQRLVWAWALARMDFGKRIPRKLISSWIPHKRLVGRPIAAYGNGLVVNLEIAGIDIGTWHVLAQDPKVWTEIFMDRDNIHIRPENPFYFGQLPAPSNPRPQTYAEVVIEVPKPIDSDCVVLNSLTGPISRTVVLNISLPKIPETVQQQILSELPSAEMDQYISEPIPSHSM